MATVTQMAVKRMANRKLASGVDGVARRAGRKRGVRRRCSRGGRPPPQAEARVVHPAVARCVGGGGGGDGGDERRARGAAAAAEKSALQAEVRQLRAKVDEMVARAREVERGKRPARAEGWGVSRRAGGRRGTASGRRSGGPASEKRSPKDGDVEHLVDVARSAWPEAACARRTPGRHSGAMERWRFVGAEEDAPARARRPPPRKSQRRQRAEGVGRARAGRGKGGAKVLVMKSTSGRLASDAAKSVAEQLRDALSPFPRNLRRSFGRRRLRRQDRDRCLTHSTPTAGAMEAGKMLRRAAVSARGGLVEGVVDQWTGLVRDGAPRRVGGTRAPSTRACASSTSRRRATGSRRARGRRGSPCAPPPSTPSARPARAGSAARASRRGRCSTPSSGR